MLGGLRYLWPGFLAILGIWWCKEVFSRLGKDIKRLKESESKPEKAAIIIYWILTPFVIAGIVYWLYFTFTHFAWSY